MAIFLVITNMMRNVALFRNTKNLEQNSVIYLDAEKYTLELHYAEANNT